MQANALDVWGDIKMYFKVSWWRSEGMHKQFVMSEHLVYEYFMLICDHHQGANSLPLVKLAVRGKEKVLPPEPMKRKIPDLSSRVTEGSKSLSFCQW